MSTEPIRVNVRELFTSLGLTPKEAHDLEIGVYNTSLDIAKSQGIMLSWGFELFREVYLSKARSAYANIYADSYIQNPKLLERLKEGEFLPHEIATMSHFYVQRLHTKLHKLL
jgi:hypothetical protein